MSRLPAFKRLPARPALRIVDDENDPIILPFLRKPWRASVLEGLRAARNGRGAWPAGVDTRLRAGQMDPLSRARALHENRCCPQCRRAGAIPLDLGDGDDRNPAMPVPGSSTLVGFCCDACGAEWPV